MCDCLSTNWQIGEVENVVLDAGEHFEFAQKELVCVDACIVEQITMLWANAIWTENSCCGHNRINPSVVIGEGGDAVQAAALLREHDPDREWDVLQWQLVKVSDE